MKNRWRMNRIGLINFWLYDKEEFEFEDGKLLLRGQNGSGKSITTQSFIPFILDGDRSPSRLDPFGTSDRRMEYYFLGEGDKEESTGYLYLEFKKEDTNEYRTIGIGQTARKGKQMTFWGFVILDNRRIESDLFLYKNAGNKIIPLDKQELKKVLGENTPFTDSPKTYKEMVNKYLFGFDRIDQYDQFIKLLIKVRAPKLSNDFKPTKVYDLLNESLQVLSDDDLRTMVDAMEKMDSIQESLEGLKRALNDASSILKEYNHYNKYMLAKKAHNFLNGEKEAKDASSNYLNTINEIEVLRQKQAELNSKLNRLEVESDAIKKELEQLSDPEIDNLSQKYQIIKNDLLDNEDNKEKKENQINNKRNEIRLLELSLDNLSREVTSYNQTITKIIKNLDELQNEIQSDFHLSIKEAINKNETLDKNIIDNKINSLKKLIQSGKELIIKTSDLQNKYDECSNRLDENKKLLDAKQFEYDSLNKEKEKEQDNLINSIYSLKANKVWVLKEETINKAVALIDDYSSELDSLKLQETLMDDFNILSNYKNKVITKLSIEEKTIKDSIYEKEKEYRKVSEQKLIEPLRDNASSKARELLAKANIQAYPFYQLVDFNPELANKEQAILEQQLYKAGILDSLVVTKDNYQRIQNEFPSLNDVIIFEENNSNDTFNGLIIDTSYDEKIQEAVRNILSCFSNENGKLILKKNGYFKHGIIQGTVNKETSEYIGVNARKRKKQMLLDAIQEEIDILQEQLDSKQAEIENEKQLLDTMKLEYVAIYSTETINDLINKLKELSIHINQLSAEQERLEKAASFAYETFKNCEREMLYTCNLLPYTRSAKEYEIIINYLDEYKDEVSSLIIQLNRIDNINSLIISKNDSKDNLLEEADNLYLDIENFNNKITSLNQQLDSIKQIMDSPEIIERARRLQDAKDRESLNIKNTIEVNKQIAITNDKLMDSDSIINKLKELKEEKEDLLQKTKLYFEEELELHFVIEENDALLKDNAHKAISLEEENYKNKTAEMMAQSLFEAYQKSNSNLSTYNTKIERTSQDSERSRLVVTSIIGGKKLPLGDFVKQLQGAIETQEELIKEKDRELFEDILSQTISQKLTDKIHESSNWAKDMSSLMKKMDTSMGLSFSLDWKPKKPEDSDEMDVRELEKLLTKDSMLISEEEISKVAKHFRSIIQREKARQEMNNETPNYMDLVRNALDYRKWYEFKMSYIRTNEAKKDLTNAAFNRFSGGEKAMAMYVPLFAAVNAQYQKANATDHPRIIALDEAFAGVDEKNIATMFEMVESLDFDYIMNSQALWGCYETVKNLKISELLRPANADYISVINYIWNGKEKILHDR